MLRRRLSILYIAEVPKLARLNVPFPLRNHSAPEYLLLLRTGRKLQRQICVILCTNSAYVIVRKEDVANKARWISRQFVTCSSANSRQTCFDDITTDRLQPAFLALSKTLPLRLTLLRNRWNMYERFSKILLPYPLTVPEFDWPLGYTRSYSVANRLGLRSSLMLLIILLSIPE